MSLLNKIVAFCFLAAALLGCKSSLFVTGKVKKIQIEKVNSLQVRDGSELIFNGKNLDDSILIRMEGQIVDYSIDSDQEGHLIVPYYPNSGIVKVNFYWNELLLSSQPLLYINGDVGRSLLLNEENICDDQVFRNESGELVRGTRICDQNIQKCGREGEVRCLSTSQWIPIAQEGLANKLAVGQSMLGIAGQADDRLTDCVQDGQIDCISNSKYAAFDRSLVSPANIKEEVAIAGVIGKYPSASFPLEKSSATVSLESSTFNSQIRSNDVFEWLDSAGNRFTASGSNQLASENIKYGISLFGVQGDFGDGILIPPELSIPKVTNTSISLNTSLVCCTVSKILIVASSNPISFVPANGNSYAEGTILDVPTNLKVIHNGADKELLFEGLNSNVMYYFKTWSYKEGNLEYSSTSNSTFAKTSFPVAAAGDMWSAMSTTSEGMTQNYPRYDAGSQSIMITDAAATFYQANILFSSTPRSLPLTVEFDYKLTSNGGDGLAFIFGKDFDEYASKIMPTGSALGLIRGSGYAVTFLTGDANKLGLKDLASNTSLSENNNIDLEDASKNFEHHVKVVSTRNRITVYLDNSPTPSLDYAASVDWDMTYPYVGFS